MTWVDRLKARLKRALARFAARKAEEQTAGMVQEAREMVESTKRWARRNPAGFVMLLVLGIGLIVFQTRQKRHSSKVS